MLVRWMRIEEATMPEMTPEEDGPRVGERIVFWAWAAVLAVGLVIMIAIPLAEM
jgi:hypothetical protein